MCSCNSCTVICAVKRDNVIFALTHHGGHLGYFEGGIVHPNSVTWLDRIVVEFSNALLCCQVPQNQMYATGNSCSNCEPLTEKLLWTKDDDGDDDDVIELSQQHFHKSATPTLASSNADTENKLAEKMVAEILRVSASMVYDDMDA